MASKSDRYYPDEDFAEYPDEGFDEDSDQDDADDNQNDSWGESDQQIDASERAYRSESQQTSNSSDQPNNANKHPKEIAFHDVYDMRLRCAVPFPVCPSCGSSVFGEDGIDEDAALEAGFSGVLALAMEVTECPYCHQPLIARNTTGKMEVRLEGIAALETKRNMRRAG